jgi:hypothetical protein
VNFDRGRLPWREFSRRAQLQPSAHDHIRIARPAAHFAAAKKFWIEGIGLDLLGETDGTAEGGHALAFLGFPLASWHLELVDTQEFMPVSTLEDLFVIYLAAPVDEATIARIAAAGGTRVTARNPYWDKYGVSFKDPDGYLCVLCSRSW